MKKTGLLASALALVIGISCIPFASAATTPYVESDTTISFARSQNESYQVKFTVHGTHANPQIVAGNGSVLQTQNVVKKKDSNGNDVYYFKVKAIGAPGTTSAIYTTLSGQSAVQHFVITVMSAEYITNKLKEAALPIDNIIVYTEKTDENNLLGRPNQYISKTNFADTTVVQGDDKTEPTGGSVEIFKNAADLNTRKTYLESVFKSFPLFAQYLVVNGNYLLRIDHAVTPENAKKYEVAFAKLK